MRKPDFATVLVVDDVAASRYTVRRVLENVGYRVIEGATGAEALELAMSQPDIVIIDVGLPDMLGFDVAQQLKSNSVTSRIPILHLSATYTSGDAKALGLESGADAYLTHPFEPQVLIATVRVLLRASAAESARDQLLEREKSARAEADATAQHFRHLAEAIPQIVWTTGPDGVCDYYNQHWWEYTGLDPKSEFPRWPGEHSHQEDRHGAQEQWNLCVQEGKQYDAELRLRRSDGRHCWHLVRAIPFHAGDGRTVRWFGTCTDVDEQKGAAEERAKLIRELQEALRSRDDFLSMASHDLKGPLAAIQLRIHLMMRAIKENPRQVLQPEYIDGRLEKLDSQVGRLIQLLQRLLNISQITAGRLELQLEEMDLSAAVRETAEPLRDIIKRTGSKLIVSAEQPVIGVWDRVRLEEVIHNLISNATKYGDGKPIQVALTSENEMARLVVRDHGIGIAADDRERLFKRFERLARQREEGSFGLGLWIVNRIVDALGGRIHVASELGVGSTFTIELPLRPQPNISGFSSGAQGGVLAS